MADFLPLSVDELEQLRKAYTPQEVPPCRVCGGKLSIQATGGGEYITWGCGTWEEDPDRPGQWRPKAGRRAADEHYGQSIFVQYRVGDDRVIRLIDHVRRFQAHTAKMWVALTELAYLRDELRTKNPTEYAAREPRAWEFAWEAIRLVVGDQPWVEHVGHLTHAARLLRGIRDTLYEFNFDCKVIDGEVWQAVDTVLQQLDNPSPPPTGADPS